MNERASTREQIIEKAMELMDECGLAAFQMSAVAAAMGMRTPSLYNHFKGLDDLVRAVQLRTNELLFLDMQSAAVGVEGKRAFRALCHAYRDFFRQHKGIYETMTVPIGLDDTELLAATFRPVDLVTKILASVRMDADLGVHVMRCIRAALHGFVSLEARGNMVLQVNADDSFNMLLEMLEVGVWGRVGTPDSEAT